MLCFFYKRLIEKQIDRHAVCNPWVKTHLSKCRHCIAYYDSLKDVENELAESRSLKFPPERIACIEAAVLQNISDKTMNAKSEIDLPSKHLPIKFVLRPIAAVLIATLLIGIYLNHSEPQEPVINNNLITQIVDDSQKLQSQIIQFAKLPEQPIQNEIQKLTDDIKNTLIFLKNCTPQTPPEIEMQMDREY